MDEMTGLGPLEALLKDPSIADILINRHQNIFVERRGLLEPVPSLFKDEAHLMRIIQKIVSAVGRRVDESSPLCDARLLDGSRFNCAVRPIGVDGPLVSIRKFSKSKLSLEKLVEVGAIKPQMAELLAAAVKARITTIVSGGTGSGKTTMLNALSAYISHTERLITIEDAAELQLQQPHVARMETRPPNIEGKGEIRQRDLVKNALRMRPERIILGECRGEEAFDMLQAMNTGHEGSMATIHANNPREAISRLEQMIGMAGLPMSQLSIRGQISAAIRLIIQLQRLADGKRRVTSVAEITGMEGGDHPDAGDLQVRAHRNRAGRHHHGPPCRDGRPPALPDRAHRPRDQHPGQLLRPVEAAVGRCSISIPCTCSTPARRSRRCSPPRRSISRSTTRRTTATASTGASRSPPRRRTARRSWCSSGASAASRARAASPCRCSGSTASSCSPE